MTKKQALKKQAEKLPIIKKLCILAAGPLVDQVFNANAGKKYYVRLNSKETEFALYVVIGGEEPEFFCLLANVPVLNYKIQKNSHRMVDVYHTIATLYNEWRYLKHPNFEMIGWDEISNVYFLTERGLE